MEELNLLKKQRKEKSARKEARSNRRRLPKRDPMTYDIYKKLIRAAEGPTYLNVRLRIAFCILAVTGIRINELLPLKVYQLETLINSNWIAIDRSKRGPSNHKAFLTKEGKKIIEDRKKGFRTDFFNERIRFLRFYIRSQSFPNVKSRNDYKRRQSSNAFGFESIS